MSRRADSKSIRHRLSFNHENQAGTELVGESDTALRLYRPARTLGLASGRDPSGDTVGQSGPHANFVPELLHPLPTNGIFVAITVIDNTFASSGRSAI